MAGSFSDYLENAVLRHVLKGTALSQPTNLYLALFTVAPTDAGGGTEVSGGSYARVVCNAWTVTTNQGKNTSDTSFVEATGNWGTIVAFGLFDASSGGNLLVWGDLTTSKAIAAGDTAIFKANDLTITLD